MSVQRAANRTAASLYPFLEEDPTLAPPSVSADEIRQGMIEKIREIIQLRRTVEERDGTMLARCAREMAERFGAGGRLFTFGNGGSATDARTFAELFAPRRPAVALTSDIAVITALANDVDFDVVFSRQVAAWARPADMAAGLSTSGNSENIVSAFATARRAGLLTVGFAGYDGGAMARSADIDFLFVTPSTSVHRIQEAQTTTYHVLWELIAR